MAVHSDRHGPQQGWPRITHREAIERLPADEGLTWSARASFCAYDGASSYASCATSHACWCEVSAVVVDVGTVKLTCQMISRRDGGTNQDELV